MADFFIAVGSGSTALSGQNPNVSLKDPLVETGSIGITRYEPTVERSYAMSIAATLPQFYMYMEGEQGPITGSSLSFSFDLPQFTLEAEVMDRLDWEIELPMLAIEAAISSEQQYAMEIDLPALQVTAQVEPGRTYAGSITLPQFEVESFIGESNFVLPVFQVEGTLASGSVITADLYLPMLAVEAEVQNPNVLSGALALPMLSMAADVIPGNAGSFAFTLPQFAVESEGIAGVSGIFLFSLPMFEVEGEAYGEYAGDFDLYLPAFQVRGGLSFAYDNTVAYNLNVMNAAVTEYVNYEFNSFARFHGATLAANENGLYLLTGSDDAGTAIDAIVEYGDLDFGTSLYKRVIAAYIGYQNDGDLVLTVNTDTDRFKYRLPHIGKTAFHTNKMNLAKGIRSRYWRFGMYNVDGADFTLDTLEAVPVILTRRIG